MKGGSVGGGGGGSGSAGGSAAPGGVAQPRTGQGGSAAPGGVAQPRTGHLRAAWADWRLLAQEAGQRGAMLMNGGMFLAWACELSVVTVHATEVWGATPGSLGSLFAIVWATGLVGTPLGGWLADRHGRKAVIVPAFAVSSLALGTLAFSTGFWSFALPLGVWGMGSSMMMPALSAYCVEVSDVARRATALSLQRQAGDLVWLVAPVGLGVFADWASTSSAILLASGLATSATLAFAAFAPEPEVKMRGT